MSPLSSPESASCRHSSPEARPSFESRCTLHSTRHRITLLWGGGGGSYCVPLRAWCSLQCPRERLRPTLFPRGGPVLGLRPHNVWVLGYEPGQSGCDWEGIDLLDGGSP